MEFLTLQALIFIDFFWLERLTHDSNLLLIKRTPKIKLQMAEKVFFYISATNFLII